MKKSTKRTRYNRRQFLDRSAQGIGLGVFFGAGLLPQAAEAAYNSPTGDCLSAINDACDALSGSGARRECKHNLKALMSANPADGATVVFSIGGVSGNWQSYNYTVVSGGCLANVAELLDSPGWYVIPTEKATNVKTKCCS